MKSFYNLELQQKKIKNEIQKSIRKVLNHGKYILGPEVYLLENKLCEYTGSKYCITCANGTDALQISLMAIGVGPDDEVIVPAFSYISTAEVVTLLGAKVRYVDVCPDTFNIDVSIIERNITNKTKAIIPVSLFGQPCDFNRINKIANKYGITVIEDAAQSFGSEYNNNKSCNLSELACTSFFPTKPLGCYGDGGAIFTSNKELADIVRKIARHGQERKYYHTKIGVNSRLDTLQASILLCKLKILDIEIKQRNKVALFYQHELKKNLDIETPFISSLSKSSWAQYTIKSKKREQLKNKLTKYNIPTAIYYPMPIYRQPAFSENKYLRISEQLSEIVLSLPMNPYLSEKDIINICDLIN